MNPPLRVIITEGALKDLTAIADHISMDSPQNAGAVVDDPLRAMESLDQLSGRFKVVGRRKSTRSDVHAMVVGSYIVYYSVEECAEGGVRSHGSARGEAAAAAVSVIGPSDV